MTTRLLLVRHGETEWNADGRFMGQLDIPMDPKGVAQVAAVSKRLFSERPAAIYTSNLSRAVDTALAIQSAIASLPPVIEDARLSEMGFGDWQGRTYSEIKEADSERLTRWEADLLHEAPPGGETLEAFTDRVKAAYLDICAAHPDQCVIIAGHGGSLKALIVLGLGLAPEALRRLSLANGSLSELRIEQAGVTLQFLNDTSHLPAIG